MFNRQIESMDLQHRIGFAQDITGAISGTASAGISGATTGLLAGAPVAAGIGAAAGTTLSAAAGVADIATNRMLRADLREATIQQHNWQLQNIQALPYSVTKVNNFNVDSNYVPYLEVYVCEDTETDNFIKYLALRSYTINRYGKLNDYIKPTGRTFIKGMIVRLAEVDDDSHYLAAIADEVNQGFYIEKGGESTTA